MVRAFIHVDIELMNSCTGLALMSLWNVEVFIMPGELNMISHKWIERKIAHMLFVGSPHHCMVLDMSLQGHAMPSL